MTLTKFTIDAATAEDYDALCQLFDEVDALHRQRLPHLFQKIEPVREQDYFLDLVADENVGLFVARAGKAPIGFVNAVLQEAPALPLFIPRRYAIVNDITVVARYRTSGVGRMLMDRVHQWAQDKGAIAVELAVYEFNQGAIAFYERLGYETLSRRMTKSLSD
ncbi:MAG: GNAT family N-acetyltransferase [Cyanobacteria bacterium CRU_2_1]|nr:GNAT family N-acetyltransferase [Cyanobacteria bacterium RU_5_0]NJR63154.1 GNAT family N-acetyltransferase [Cyanobacteria bacterium CRU_2_1]